MKYICFVILPLLLGVNATPRNKILRTEPSEDAVTFKQIDGEKDNLKTAASSYSRQYSDWGGNSPGGYGYSVTGFGVIDDRYDSNYGSLVGYDNSFRNIGNTGDISNAGYVGNTDYSGYKSFGRYSPNGFDGNGGYGGHGGNGGLNSYYGYNNPHYQGFDHLGYGYYNRRPGYGNIYNSGITPNLVTGYRGYTRR